MTAADNTAACGMSSWAPRESGEDSPWMRMFRNARIWAG